MKFCPPRIVSTFAAVNPGFCLRVVVSTLESVQLDVCLLGFCPLGSLAIWHSTNVGFCPLLVLSTLDSAHVLFCLIGIIFTLVIVYLAALCLQVWPHDILLRWVCVHCWFCQLWILLTCGSVYFKVNLGVRLLEISQLGSLSTRHSAHVGLCPLLVLSTLDCANCWFRLLGSLSIWVFVYLDSVQLGVWRHDILPTKNCVYLLFRRL